MRPTSGCLILGCLFFAVGCNSRTPTLPEGVEVSGKIHLASGACLSGGTLVLRPVSGIYGATASIQPNGSFKLVDSSGRHAVAPGRYQVYVLVNNGKDKALARSVPAKYQSSEDGNSDVEIDIQDAVSDLIIRLKS